MKLDGFLDHTTNRESSFPGYLPWKSILRLFGKCDFQGYV